MLGVGLGVGLDLHDSIEWLSIIESIELSLSISKYSFEVCKYKL